MLHTFIHWLLCCEVVELGSFMAWQWHANLVHHVVYIYLCITSWTQGLTYVLAIKFS